MMTSVSPAPWVTSLRLTPRSFYINLPLNGVATVIILLTFKSSKISRHEEDANAPLFEKLRQMDLSGTFCIMAAIICFLLAMQRGGVTKSWSFVDVIGTLVGFCLLIIAFLGIEYWQKDRALLLFHILKQRVVYVGCIISFLYVQCILSHSVKGLTVLASVASSSL